MNMIRYVFVVSLLASASTMHSIFDYNLPPVSIDAYLKDLDAFIASEPDHRQALTEAKKRLYAKYKKACKELRRLKRKRDDLDEWRSFSPRQFMESLEWDTATAIAHYERVLALTSPTSPLTIEIERRLADFSNQPPAGVRKPLAHRAKKH